MKNRNFFDLIDNEEKAYWLGFFYADGSLRKSGKQLDILISAADADHLQKFGLVFDLPVKTYTLQPDKRTGKRYSHARVVISCKHMWDQLHEKGIPQLKSLAETSEILNYVPDDLVRHFVRGYFDGDRHIGCVNKTEWRVVIAGTYTLLNAIQQIMCSNLSLRKTKITTSGSIFHLQWGGVRQLDRIKKWFYDDANIYLARKKLKFDQLPAKRGSSKYQGVYHSNSRGKWVARIYYEGKTRHIGCYDNEEDAAKAYDAKVVEHYGQDVSLNFPARK